MVPDGSVPDLRPQPQLILVKWNLRSLTWGPKHLPLQVSTGLSSGASPPTWLTAPPQTQLREQ